MHPLIRLATPTDLAQLAAVEDAADRMLIEWLRPERWDAPPSGAERSSDPGFLVTAVAAAQGGEPEAVLGFAHVLLPGAQSPGVAHLEQLSVAPEHGGGGIGSALLSAALAEAAHRGLGSVTLRTFLDVPWNAPWYAQRGFAASEPADAWHLALVATEASLGLDRLGARTQMTHSLLPVHGEQPLN